MQSVRDYFEIQRKRVGDRILFEMEYDGSFKHVRIPGMVLQPLIENSIIHGVKDMVHSAHIRVDVRWNADRVQIIVEDNGAGVTADIIDDINSASFDNSSSNGVGLANVRKRLVLFYGDDFRFLLEPLSSGMAKRDDGCT